MKFWAFGLGFGPYAWGSGFEVLGLVFSGSEGKGGGIDFFRDWDCCLRLGFAILQVPHTSCWRHKTITRRTEALEAFSDLSHQHAEHVSFACCDKSSSPLIIRTSQQGSSRAMPRVSPDDAMPKSASFACLSFSRQNVGRLQVQVAAANTRCMAVQEPQSCSHITQSGRTLTAWKEP